MALAAAPKFAPRASGGERAVSSAGALAGAGGAGRGAAGLRGGARAGGLSRRAGALGSAGWGRGPASPRGPSHCKDPNLLGESQPEGGALGAAVGCSVRARMRLPAPLPGRWDLRVSGEALTHAPLFSEQTEAADGRVLPKVTQRRGTPDSQLLFPADPGHSACRCPHFSYNCRAWVNCHRGLRLGTSNACASVSVSRRVCEWHACLCSRACARRWVCSWAPGRREEVARLALGVCAGPVVSRPGRWELSSGINCLFVSGWEVAPAPDPPPSGTSCSPSRLAPGVAAIRSGRWLRVLAVGQPETRGRARLALPPTSCDARAPCWPPRIRRPEAREPPGASRPGTRRGRGRAEAGRRVLTGSAVPARGSPRTQ